MFNIHNIYDDLNCALPSFTGTCPARGTPSPINANSAE